jgi:hypothetical protein
MAFAPLDNRRLSETISATHSRQSPVVPIVAPSGGSSSRATPRMGGADGFAQASVVERGKSHEPGSVRLRRAISVRIGRRARRGAGGRAAARPARPREVSSLKRWDSRTGHSKDPARRIRMDTAITLCPVRLSHRLSEETSRGRAGRAAARRRHDGHDRRLARMGGTVEQDTAKIRLVAFEWIQRLPRSVWCRLGRSTIGRSRVLPDARRAFQPVHQISAVRLVQAFPECFKEAQSSNQRDKKCSVSARCCLYLSQLVWSYPTSRALSTAGCPSDSFGGNTTLFVALLQRSPVLKSTRQKVLYYLRRNHWGSRL